MINSDLFFLIFNLSHKSSVLDQLMIFGANYLIFLMFLGVIVLGTMKGGGNLQGLLLTLISLPLVFLFTKAFHLFFYQPRPFTIFPINTLIDHSASASFPSLHASVAFTLAFSFLFSPPDDNRGKKRSRSLLWKFHPSLSREVSFTKSKWGNVLLILATWVGFSRVFVGVHYPLDILGGIIVALISVTLGLKPKTWLASQGDALRA